MLPGLLQHVVAGNQTLFMVGVHSAATAARLLGVAQLHAQPHAQPHARTLTGHYRCLPQKATVNLGSAKLSDQSRFISTASLLSPIMPSAEWRMQQSALVIGV